jgi:hypothetical protein
MNRRELMNRIAADVDSVIHTEILEHNEHQDEKRKRILQRQDWFDNPDAMVWAEKFVEMLKANPDTLDPSDAGCMVSWFANAMAARERVAPTMAEG